MKLRFILPAIFLIVAILFLVVNLMGAGHGPDTFDFLRYFIYPACLLSGLLNRVLGGPALIWFLLCIVLGAVQYFLLGYLIDWLLQRRRNS